MRRKRDKSLVSQGKSYSKEGAGSKSLSLSNYGSKTKELKPNIKKSFIFIAGPCVIENKDLTYRIAAELREITAKYNLNFIFKASFYKANRTSLKSFRGPGLAKGIRILSEIKRKLEIKILSDVHCQGDIEYIKDTVDIIQIPAFLSRQTDLVIEAAKTGKTVNIKKAQFMSPYDIKYVIEKVAACGNKNIFLTERGTCFGYNNLVVDFRSFLIMKEFGYPVIFDVTHSLQRPSADRGISGGDSKFVHPLALAGVTCGIDGIFIEVHPRPQEALSDKATSLALNKVESVVKDIVKLREALHGGERL
ncbi:MAG: 3-deoxy-8-phosphooctulonate synthase [Candidatus Omnitrophota bacterium]